MEAQIVLEYEDKKTALAVASAISPDNFRTPTGLSIETCHADGKVATTVRCTRGIPSLTATIDDLLFCASTAEKVLQAVKKLEGV